MFTVRSFPSACHVPSMVDVYKRQAMDYTTTVESRYWYDAELAVIYKHLGKTELVDLSLIHISAFLEFLLEEPDA